MKGKREGDRESRWPSSFFVWQKKKVAFIKSLLVQPIWKITTASILLIPSRNTTFHITLILPLKTTCIVRPCCQTHLCCKTPLYHQIVNPNFNYLLSLKNNYNNLINITSGLSNLGFRAKKPT